MKVDNNYHEWIRFAEMDFATAKHMFETYHPKPLEVICFHSHQVAEKMLKCFLVFHDAVDDIPKTHDLQTLFELCFKVDERFGDIKRSLGMLNRYSVIPRYPNELQIEEHDAKEAVNHANNVIMKVKEYVNVI